MAIEIVFTTLTEGGISYDITELPFIRGSNSWLSQSKPHNNSTSQQLHNQYAEIDIMKYVLHFYTVQWQCLGKLTSIKTQDIL